MRLPSIPSVPSLSHQTFDTVLGAVYVGVVTNLMLVIACLPVVVGIVTTDPARSWPLLAVLAPLCAPALSAAFTVFSRFSSSERSTDAVRTFWQAWRATSLRSLTVGALTTVVVVVLAVDVRAVWTQRVGAVAIPVFVVLIVLTVVTALHALVALAERPRARVRDALRASLYLAMRRWYLTAVSLFTLGLLLAFVAAKPAVAFGLAAAPLLYVVWANSRFTLRPALEPPDPHPVPA